MKLLTTILQVISTIPVVLYPIALFASIFTVGTSRATTLCLWLYPLPVGLLLFLSHKYNSASFAAAAVLVLPLLFLLVALTTPNYTKKHYNEAPRDFVCSPNSFLSTTIEPVNGTKYLVHYVKEGKWFPSYSRNDVAEIFDDKLIEMHAAEMPEGCKNSKGETPLDIYEVR